MKSCHFYRIAECSSNNSMTLSSLSMTFAIFHDFPGLKNGLPKFYDQGARWIIQITTLKCANKCITTNA